MTDPVPHPPRPAFSRDFPRTPELDALVEAFARGDYARVRDDAPATERASSDPAVKQAARTLVARTRPDPLAVALLAITAALLAVISAWTISRGHGH